jgi:hypothetical protein
MLKQPAGGHQRLQVQGGHMGGHPLLPLVAQDGAVVFRTRSQMAGTNSLASVTR